MSFLLLFSSYYSHVEAAPLPEASLAPIWPNAKLFTYCHCLLSLPSAHAGKPQGGAAVFARGPTLWGPSLLVCEGAAGVSHAGVERTQRHKEHQEEGWHPLPKRPLSLRPPLSAQAPFPPVKCSERPCALKFSRTWIYWVAACGTTTNNHLIFLLLVTGDIQQDHQPPHRTASPPLC